jgi:hypothetical protein
LGTLLGLLALVIAGFGGVRALRAGDVPPPPTASDTDSRVVPNVAYVKEDGELPGGDVGTLTLKCPPARGIITGGAFMGRVNVYTVQNFPRFTGNPKIPDSWAVTVANEEPLVSSDSAFAGYLICGRVGEALVAPK